MSFVHPWAIAVGLAAAAAPLVIHWLTRPRPTRMPLSTVRFVREAIRQRRARHRLRDLLILATRTVAVLLVALAVARPQWGREPLVADGLPGDAVRVVLLDVSQSMAAMYGASEQFERARTMAAGYLRYQPRYSANLILAGAAPRAVFEGPSTNLGALREELARCRVLPQRLDAAGALELAARILAPASQEDQRRRELVILSDFQRANWAKADFSVLPQQTQIQLESVAPPETPPNVAILRAAGRAPSRGGGRVAIEVEIGNFSATPRSVTAEVAIEDAVWHLKGACPAQGRTVLSEEVEIHAQGWLSGEARLTGIEDALRADNMRPLVVHVRPRPLYALLTRQAGSQRPSSSHFLECALVPDAQRQEKAASRLVRIDPAELDRSVLAPADLIVLDHPGRLSEESLRLLAGLSHRGRPILYVASELIDATNLKRLVEMAGRRIQMPVEFTPPPAGQVRQGLFLTSIRGDRPPFGVFGDSLAAAMGRLRFAGGLGSRRLEAGVEDEILAGYSDGSACLVLAGSDAGLLAVLNADLAASNVAKTQVFVPLVSELVEKMLDRRGAQRENFSGEPLVAHLPTDAGLAAGLQVLAPESAGAGDAPDRYGTLVDEPIGVVWHWNSPSPPGVFRVRRDASTVFAMALHVPAEESQLERLPPQVLTGRLAGGRALHYRGASGEGQSRDDLWKWLAAACAVALLGELAALLAFRT